MEVGEGEGGRERETDRQTERKRERGALQHPATRAFEVQLADPLLMFERIRACLPSAHRRRPPVELVSRAGRSTRTLDCVARDQPAAETGPPLPAPACNSCPWSVSAGAGRAGAFSSHPNTCTSW